PVHAQQEPEGDGFDRDHPVHGQQPSLDRVQLEGSRQPEAVGLGRQDRNSRHGSQSMIVKMGSLHAPRDNPASNQTNGGRRRATSARNTAKRRRFTSATSAARGTKSSNGCKRNRSSRRTTCEKPKLKSRS